MCVCVYIYIYIYIYCSLARAFSMIKKRINQQNAQINFWINLLLFNNIYIHIYTYINTNLANHFY